MPQLRGVQVLLLRTGNGICWTQAIDVARRTGRGCSYHNADVTCVKTKEVERMKRPDNKKALPKCASMFDHMPSVHSGRAYSPCCGPCRKDGMMQVALLTTESETSTAVITCSIEEANHSHRKICSWSVVQVDRSLVLDTEIITSAPRPRANQLS